MTITVRLGTPDLALVTYFNVSVWQDWINSPDNDQRLIFADVMPSPSGLTCSSSIGSSPGARGFKSKGAHTADNVLCQGPSATSFPFSIEPDCDKGKGPPLHALAWQRPP